MPKKRPPQQLSLVEREAIESFREHIGDPELVLTAEDVFEATGPGPYTRERQSEALRKLANEKPETGYIMRLVALCTLPRTNPGRRDRYVRKNGPYTLVMIAGGEKPRLPYGSIPRLLLAWICTEAYHTKRRRLNLGRSLSAFMRELGMNPLAGGPRGDRTRLHQQMIRLFQTSVELTHQEKQGGPMHRIADLVAPASRLWWDVRRPDESTLWDSWIELGERFFEEIIRSPMPIDMHVLRTMKRSPLGLDAYLWLTCRLFTLGERVRLPWRSLYRQFGAHPEDINAAALSNFRADFLRELEKLQLAWPDFRYSLPIGALELRPTEPRIHPTKPPPVRHINR